MRHFLRHHFPTLAEWPVQDWIMALLSGMLFVACVMGAGFPEGQQFVCEGKDCPKTPLQLYEELGPGVY